MAKFLATTVKRSAKLGEVHGRLLQCDIHAKRMEEVWSYDAPLRSDNDRGGDRGFRGIAVDTKRGQYLLTTFATVEILDRQFNFVARITHPCFIHNHAISIADDKAYICATGSDYILELNLHQNKVVRGFRLQNLHRGHPYVEVTETPQRPHDMQLCYSHLNGIEATHTGFIVSGARSRMVCEIIDGNFVARHALPPGTHDITRVNGSIFVLDTAGDRVAQFEGNTLHHHTPIFPYAKNTYAVPPNVARANFLRGLCLNANGNGLLMGYSPASLCQLNLETFEFDWYWQLDSDIRWMISGLAQQLA